MRSDTITFRIKPQTKRRLQELADREQRTVSQIVAMIIEDFLAEDNKPLPLRKRKIILNNG